MAQWAKGESGNPGGRPRQIANLRELARTYTAEAMNTLLQVMTDPKATASSRVSAAIAVLDRAYGKPSLNAEKPDEIDNYVDNETERTPLETVRRIAYLFDQAANETGQPIDMNTALKLLARKESLADAE